MISTIVVVALAFLVGMAANRMLRRRLMGEDAEALTVRDLVEPLQTLAVLVLAFVLVMAADSYSKAEDAARTEAEAVDHMYEVSDYAPRTQRRPLQAQAVCYARAVVAEEWPVMDGGRESKVPSVWSTGFRTQFKKMAGDADSQFEMLVNADKERSVARQERLSQSTPAIPAIMYWFMLLTLAVTVVALAFCLPLRRSGAEFTTLLVISALLTLSLVIIQDVDRPFGGSISVQPTAMAHTASDIGEDYVAAYGKGKLPCDARGRAL